MEREKSIGLLNSRLISCVPKSILYWWTGGE